MMGKITKGGSFGGCVDYVTRKKKDKPDGSPCDEWRLIDCKDVSIIEGREGIIESFEDNLALNPALKNPVGHISLNFHANDKDKVDDDTMTEIARKYMERMGIVDTPYIVVRHLDKEHPHCHIVFSRINNHAETISDKNDFDRNRKVCLDLTREYGLHISEGKRQTNVNKLRGTEKIRYEIFNSIEAVWNDKSVYTFEQFEARLKAASVGIEYKYRRGSNGIQGFWYTRKGRRFAASKIDRRFSFGNIKNHLAANKPLHPQSKWMYADGSIVPFYKYAGVKLTPSQVKNYTAGQTIKLDGCSGDYSTVYVKFNSQRLVPEIFSSNPDMPGQVTSQSYNTSIRVTNLSAGNPASQEEGFAQGSALPDDFKLWLRRHPGLTIDEARTRYREEQKAKRRRQGPKLH